MQNDDEISIKWWDTKQFVGVGEDGDPQVISVEPIITRNGELVLDKVTVRIDSETHVMGREEAEVLISTLNCSPIETATQFKNFWTH